MLVSKQLDEQALKQTCFRHAAQLLEHPAAGSPHLRQAVHDQVVEDGDDLGLEECGHLGEQRRDAVADGDPDQRIQVVFLLLLVNLRIPVEVDFPLQQHFEKGLLRDILFKDRALVVRGVLLLQTYLLPVEQED